jgi:hypothetical protein
MALANTTLPSGKVTPLFRDSRASSIAVVDTQDACDVDITNAMVTAQL